jgi:gas vesicle protein
MRLEQQKVNNIVGFLAGIAAGTLVGVSLAILFAPSSGEEMRQQLRERAEYVRDEVQRARDERRAELEQQLADLRSPRRPSSPV